jgi:hypothetical protein
VAFLFLIIRIRNSKQNRFPGLALPDPRPVEENTTNHEMRSRDFKAFIFRDPFCKSSKAEDVDRDDEYDYQFFPSKKKGQTLKLKNGM